MKRILLLATVAALMATMLVAMASAALALPPPGRPAGGTQGTAGGSLGCEGVTYNASHAVDNSNPSNDATRSNPSAVDAPAVVPLNNAPGYQQGENVGLNNASDTRPLNSHDNCQNDPPQHPLG